MNPPPTFYLIIDLINLLFLKESIGKYFVGKVHKKGKNFLKELSFCPRMQRKVRNRLILRELNEPAFTAIKTYLCNLLTIKHGTISNTTMTNALSSRNLENERNI